MPTPKLRQWLGIELIEVSLVEKLVATIGGGLSIFLLVVITHWAGLQRGGKADCWKI